MAFKITYEATSDLPCVVDTLGEFEAGETKSISDSDVELFKLKNGYPLGAARFAYWFHLTAHMTEEATSDAA